MKNKIYIIGVGRVGSAFAFEMKDIGEEVSYLTDRNSGQLKTISGLVNPVETSDKVEKEFIIGSDLIFICVQDRFIEDVIKEISNFDLDLSTKFFAHTSGSLSSDVFKVGKFNSDNIFSMHSVQTFDEVNFENNKLLTKIYFGIEGGEAGIRLAKELINKLDSNYVIIPKEKKYLYHAACVVASNFLITLVNISSELIGSIGIDKAKAFEIFKPIIEKTITNISENGLVNSLTGPFERNDVEIIAKHLSSIKEELPSLLPFYTLLGMETAKVAFKKESINLKNVISILDLMNEYISGEFDLSKKRN